MKLFHASNIIVFSPSTSYSRDYLDFGKGFYLTSIHEQAVNYAKRFTRRGQTGWVNVYDFNIVLEQWKVLRFDCYNKEWLDFIAKNRAGLPVDDYDLIIGGIANDKVIRTLDRYFDGRISQQEALDHLIYEEPNIQYCIRSQELINECLTFIKYEQI